MKILFLTLGQFDNINQNSVYSDLLRYFSNHNHSIFVVTQLERKENCKTYIQKYNNLSILRVKIGNITKTSLIRKGISTILLPYLFKKAINKYFSKITFDLILYTTPPITFNRIVKEIKKKHKAKTYLMLKDIFPQNALDLGLLRKRGLKGIIYKYFCNKEKILYQISDKIGCMSEANKKYILSGYKYLNREKVEICPNTIDSIKIKEYSKKDLRKTLKLPLNKKVLIYGGNFGKPQNVDFIVNILIDNEKNDNIHYVMIGAGTEFYKIQDRKKQLKNTTILSYMSKNKYLEYLKASDVGLIFLDDRFSIPNFPSRMLDYMNYSLPIFACTDSNTDIGEVLSEGDFGCSVRENNLALYSSSLNRLIKTQDLIKMGQNSKKFLEEKYCTSLAYNQIINSIN